MRLYNSASCTPVAAWTGGAKRSPPNKYLPEGNGPTNQNHKPEPKTSHDRNLSKILQGRAVETKESSADHLPRKQERSTGRKVFGFFPARNFLFDIEEDEMTGTPDEQKEYEDNSRMSSSTLSTHTTLREAQPGAATIHEKMYGIRMPFPTPNNTSNDSGRKSHKSLYAGKNQEGGISYGPLKTNGSLFEIVKNGDLRIGWPHESARKCSNDIQRKFQETMQSSPREEPYENTEIHQCPQLAMTESSESQSSSSWLDFSSQCEENPFHEHQGGKICSFSPMEKVSPPCFRCPSKTPDSSSHLCRASIVSNRESDPATRKLRYGTAQNSTHFGPQIPAAFLGNAEWAPQPVLESPHMVASTSNLFDKQALSSFNEVYHGHPMYTRNDHSSMPTFHSPHVTMQPVAMYENLDFSKYSIMLTSGLSLGCVNTEMRRDNVDSSIIDLIMLASHSGRA